MRYMTRHLPDCHTQMAGASLAQAARPCPRMDARRTADSFTLRSSVMPVLCRADRERERRLSEPISGARPGKKLRAKAVVSNNAEQGDTSVPFEVPRLSSSTATLHNAAGGETSERRKEVETEKQNETYRYRQTKRTKDRHTETMPLDLPESHVPRHIAIIMDGNARWAARRGRKAQFGHESGVGPLKESVRCCCAWGIKALTVYAFSAENWGREPHEVQFLLRLMAKVLQREAAELAAEGVRLRFIGDINGLPPFLQDEIARARDTTSGCSRLHLSIAVNYSGRSSVTAAARALAQEVAQGLIDPSEIDEAAVERHLRRGQGGGELPAEAPVAPDLVLRTSSEKRLSNFLLWEAAYAELIFTDTFWPDFSEEDLRTAILEFASRQRRFGCR